MSARRLTAVTFSIVGRSDDGTTWGVAVASKFVAVGALVPAAAAGVGALATQADVNVTWKRLGMQLLRDGVPASEVVRRLVAEDDLRDERQLGLVDAHGGSATHTGAGCLNWAGGISAPGVAIQGNILAGPDVVAAMHSAWQASAQRPLAHRLLDALAAGDAAGGDRRGRQSAALFVVREGAGYNAMDDLVADLRVDDDPAPVVELARLLDLNDFYLTAPPEDDRLPVDSALAAELEAQAHARGHDDFAAWVGTENWEMRVAADLSWIDRRVLQLVRTS
jgi:uncharacterized Ntn-hydrolase superfamily protein